MWFILTLVADIFPLFSLVVILMSPVARCYSVFKNKVVVYFFKTRVDNELWARSQCDLVFSMVEYLFVKCSRKLAKSIQWNPDFWTFKGNRNWSEKMGFRKNEFESSIDSHLTMVLFYKNQTGLSHVNVCTIFMYKQNVMYPAGVN